MSLRAQSKLAVALTHDRIELGVNDMRVQFAQFLKSEDGAVTVDWVVLTAAIVGLGIAVIATVADGALGHSAGVGAHLTAQEIATY